jgi:hypothetical protein
MNQCPQCGQQDIYKINAYCMAHQRNSSGAMVIAGGDGHGHGGIGGGLTSSSSQSALAASFLPGQKPVQPGALTGCLAAVLVISVLFGCVFLGEAAGPFLITVSIATAVIFGVVALCGGGWDKMTEKSNALHAQKMQAWEERVNRYNNGWLCVRCGHSWIPQL